MSNFDPLDKDQILNTVAQMEKAMDRITELYRERGANHWTSLDDMDELLGHPSAGEVFVVAGGEHETTAQDFGLSIVANMALTGTESAFLSTASRWESHSSRLESALSRVPLERLHKGGLDETESESLKRAREQLAAAPLTIQSMESAEADNVISAIREIKGTNPDTSLVVIDSAQEAGRSRERSIDAYEPVMRALRDLAAESGLVIMLLTTFSEQEIADRRNKRPVIADLEPSRSMINHASRVLLLFDESRWDSMSPHEELLEVIVAHNQFGLVGTFPCVYQPEYARVESYRDQSAPINGSQRHSHD